jgi:(1->4)-alpha-D-glucan 1-alpha-D-glucosylmutase
VLPNWSAASRRCWPRGSVWEIGEFHGFVTTLGRLAAISSLSQLVLKLTVPGVPDIYQGGELWDFNMVDPDNRRPVDWAGRRRLLGELAAAAASDLADQWHDGREKLFIIHRLLGMRRSWPELFAQGDYRPLDVEGSRSDHLCAFIRSHNDHGLAVAAPRLVSRLYRGGVADWGSTRFVLPPGTWRDVFSGCRHEGGAAVSVSQLLANFPVAVLAGEPGA